MLQVVMCRSQHKLQAAMRKRKLQAIKLKLQAAQHKLQVCKLGPVGRGVLGNV